MRNENGGALGTVLFLIVLVGVAVVSFVMGQKSSSVDLANIASSVQGAEEQTADPQNNPVLAKINGEEIRRQDVVKLVNTMPAQMRQIPIEQLFPMALEQAISNKIVDTKAVNAGLQNDPDVKKKLELAQEQFIRSKYIENEVGARLTEERLKQSYDGYVNGFPDVQEVKAAHILIEDEKIAKDLIKKLDKGEDFAALAQEHSKDGSAENGGDLGYFAQNEVVPEFAEATFALEVGKYTQKPVKSQFGYHIIKVEEKRKRPPADYETVKPFLENELKRSILDEILTEWKTAASIERFDINGNPLPEESEPAAGKEESQAVSEASEPAAAAQEE